MATTTRTSGRSALRRRAAGSVLAVIALTGLSVASAAQLDTAPGTLQAGTATVVSCQPEGQPIRIALTSSFSGGEYRATQVRLLGVSGSCDGTTFRLRLLDPSGAALASVPEMTGPVSIGAGTGTVSVDLPSTPVEDIGRVAVMISG